ncbi:low temperature requirement protein A [Streptomyces pseudovenezuelae]|uniref:Low temperature requirement protein LtrA n=1 Tax=Streptomyces pseudovenezuelae TaxID=67350 RepID=A0ABT6LTW7_9ACTN|nr:low temperature requirement protein A [Streptomyces pseudovenezuelae]MDH6219736.1 low temperature requirement protein LtrA [Streptomyces pseudovenezuelae]
MSDDETTATAPQPTNEENRHASWLELFFDLVAVAGVAQIAHLLHGVPDVSDLGLYALLFLAFWTAWICFTLYANVAYENTHVRTVLAAMFGMAVMAAAVSGVHEGDDQHARVFALAYILIRGMANRAWQHRRQILVDWPAAQMSLGVVPWIVSLWAHDPTRYWLWALGIALDLYVTFAVSARDIVEHREARERLGNRPARRGSEGVASLARSQTEHLSERLGLFVIIVLGEGVAQVVEATSDAEWDRKLYALAVASFFLLATLWALSFRHGYAGVPHLAAGVLPARAALPLHCFVSGCLAALAAALGAAAEHLETLPDATRWLLCSSLAGYFLLSGLAWLGQVGRERRWLLSVAVPCCVLPLLLAAFGAHLRTVTVVWLLVLVAVWPMLYERQSTKPSKQAANTGA